MWGCISGYWREGIPLRKEVILEKHPSKRIKGRCTMKKRDGRNIGTKFSTRVEIHDFETSVLSGFYPRRRSNGVSSYCGCMFEVLSVRYKAGHLRLRLLPQIRIQRLTNNVRIVQVIFEAKIR